MAPRQSPLAQKKIREALTPKAPPPMADDEAAQDSKTQPEYEAKRLKKMKRA